MLKSLCVYICITVKTVNEFRVIFTNFRLVVSVFHFFQSTEAKVFNR